MNKLEYAHKLVVESKYSPLKAVKVAEVKIEDYNEYVKGLKEKKEVKVEEKIEEVKEDPKPTVEEPKEAKPKTKKKKK
jgi:hypothetical protein